MYNNKVISTEVINNEIYGKNAGSKNLILDVAMKDNFGLYYNFEMQNYDFDKGEEI